MILSFGYALFRWHLFSKLAAISHQTTIFPSTPSDQLKPAHASLKGRHNASYRQRPECQRAYQQGIQHVRRLQGPTEGTWCSRQVRLTLNRRNEHAPHLYRTWGYWWPHLQRLVLYSEYVSRRSPSWWRQLSHVDNLLTVEYE